VSGQAIQRAGAFFLRLPRILPAGALVDASFHPAAPARHGAMSLRGILALAIGGVALRFAVYAWMAQAHGGTAAALCQWDCHWYAGLIQNGYDRQPGANPPAYDGANWAFFPVYVLASRLVMLLTPLSAVASGILVSLLCTAGFLVVSARYLQVTRPGISIAGWIGFALAFPYSLYNSTAYTESMFLLLTAATLLAMVRRRPYATAVAASLLTATRATGVILLPPLGIERALAAWRAWQQRRDGRLLDRLADAVLPVVIAPLCLFGFMAFLYRLNGDALAFMHIQVSWNRHFDDPLVVLAAGFHRWDWHRLPFISETLSACFAVLGVLAAGFLTLRRRYLEAYVMLASVLIPLSSGLESMPRFMAGTAVFLFALYDVLALARSRLVTGAVLLLLAALQLVLVHYWYVNAHFLT
jgi:hypothetical protein